MYKLIINLKTYDESTLNNATKIAKIAKELEIQVKKKNFEIIIAASSIDLKDVVKTKVKTYAQHIDPFNAGAHTGSVIAEDVKQIGGIGTLISHSEHILSITQIKKTIEAAKKEKLETCVCARDDKTAKEIAKFKPDFIAVEPKELIGGDISITSANPDLIKKSLKAVGKVPLLVGAGVKTGKDVKIAIKLGAQGVLVASGIDKAKDVKKAIEELISEC